MTATSSSIVSVRIAAAAADRLKAGNIVAYDVTVPVAITEIMVIVTASNERQVLAVAQEIEKDLYQQDGHRQALSREGLEEAQWVLLDYGDFVVHVMHPEAREFYSLDRLWRDCPQIDLLLPQPAQTPGTADETAELVPSDATPDSGAADDGDGHLHE